MQTMCIVKGEAQKSPLFWRYSGGFLISQDRLFSRNSTRKPLNLIKSPIFTNTPCKSTCLYNAPSMHTVDKKTNKRAHAGKSRNRISPGENAFPPRYRLLLRSHGVPGESEARKSRKRYFILRVRN